MWTALFACAAAAQLIEHTGLRSLSPPLVSIALGATASALGVVPTACAEYDIVWAYLMPVAAALYLLDANLAGYVLAQHVGAHPLWCLLHCNPRCHHAQAA